MKQRKTFDDYMLYVIYAIIVYGLIVFGANFIYYLTH